MDCGALTSGPVKDRQVGELTGDNLNPLDLSPAVHTAGRGGCPNKLDLTERPRCQRKQEMEKEGAVERKKRTSAQNRRKENNEKTEKNSGEREKGREEGWGREQFRGQMG